MDSNIKDLIADEREAQGKYRARIGKHPEERGVLGGILRDEERHEEELSSMDGLYRAAYLMRKSGKEWSFENQDSRNPSRPSDSPDPKPTKIKTTDIDGEE